MKHSYILAGTTSGRLLKMILKKGISLNPKLLFRLLFLLQNGIWASFFKLREKAKYGKKLATMPAVKNPVIIIGHWRTGSTLLHQLMSLDKNLVAPTVFQVSLPDSLLVSEKYYRPVMSSMMSPTRPMDNVKLGFDEPQEDEYALLKLTGDSPLTDVIFQKTNSYFLKSHPDFNPKDLEEWKTAITNFCTKLHLASGKQVLLKNPFHSFRIKLLRETFPDVKFIHIHRHPYKVVPSTINMWNIVSRQNRLKGTWSEPTIKETAEVLNKMMVQIKKDLSALPEGSCTEVNFETFEMDPLAALKKIYNDLGLDYSPAFEEKVNLYLSGLKNYKKNVFNLDDKDKQCIRGILGDQFNHYHYLI